MTDPRRSRARSLRSHRSATIGLGALAVLSGSGALFLVLRAPATGPSAPALVEPAGARAEPALPHRSSPVARTLPAQAPGALFVPPPPPSFDSQRVAELLKDWRTAIVARDADAVLALDRLFAERPEAFLPALLESAAHDEEDRVRSFSTRVLGKLQREEALPTLRTLLGDASGFVRFNAAWALGELDDQEALASLSRLERLDPSSQVRQSAGASRRKIEGS